MEPNVRGVTLTTQQQGHYYHYHLDYIVNENGQDYKFRRTCTRHVKAPSTFTDPTALAKDLVRVERGIDVNGIGRLATLFPVVSKVLDSTATTNAAMAAMQSQLAVQTQTNVVLQQTVATQNQNIDSLKAQAQSLQNSINSLNNTIATLQAQLAVLPTLQAQISALEEEVTKLRAALNIILALI
jgi:hypothetical protein